MEYQFLERTVEERLHFLPHEFVVAELARRGYQGVCFFTNCTKYGTIITGGGNHGLYNAYFESESQTARID